MDAIDGPPGYLVLVSKLFEEKGIFANLKQAVTSRYVLYRKDAVYIQKWLSKNLQVCYGTSETSQVSTGTAEEIADIDGCVGKLLPNVQVEIVNGNKHLSEHLVKNKLFNFTDDNHRWSYRDCIQPNEILPIEFARGCIFKCSFCTYPHIGKHKNDYTKHLEYIKEELMYNYDNFGTTAYYVVDDTFNADDDFIKSFTDMSKSLPFKLKYSCYLRGDLLHGNPETEDMFLENGLVSCFFGIETFDEELAKMVGKPWSAKHAKSLRRFIFSDWANERYDYFDEYMVPAKHQCQFGLPWQILFIKMWNDS